MSKLTLKEVKVGIDQAILVSRRSYSRTHPKVIKAVVIGRTGSGKSTLLYCFAGKTLHGTDDKQYERVNVDVDESDQLIGDDGKPIRIGHGVDSETFYPNRFLTTDKTIEFFDNPGIADTNPDKRMINAFSTDQILSYPGKVVILLVISQSDFEEKAEKAYQAFDTVCEMFPDMEQLKQSICLIMTKTTIKDPAEYLDRLSKSKDRHNELINYLYEHKKERVFFFPAATVSGDFSFKDNQKVMDFIRTHAVESPKHQIALDSETVISTTRMIQPFQQLKERTVREILALFKSVVSSEKDAGILRNWQGLSESLCNAAEKGYDDFCSHCKQLGSTNPDFKRLSEKLSDLEPWDNFLADVVKGTEIDKNMKSTLSKMILMVKESLKNFGNMLSEKATQAEEIDKMKKETDDLKQQVKLGQLKVEECEKKTKEIMQEMAVREQQYAESDKKNQAVIAGLQNDIQNLSEEHDKQVQKLIETQQKQIEKIRSEYGEKMADLEEEMKKMRSAQSKRSWLQDLTHMFCKLTPVVVNSISEACSNNTTSDLDQDDMNMPEVMSGDFDLPEMGNMADMSEEMSMSEVMGDSFSDELSMSDGLSMREPLD